MIEDTELQPHPISCQLRHKLQPDTISNISISGCNLLVHQASVYQQHHHIIPSAVIASNGFADSLLPSAAGQEHEYDILRPLSPMALPIAAYPRANRGDDRSVSLMLHACRDNTRVLVRFLWYTIHQKQSE